MEVPELCPQCATILTKGHTRLVQDACGHKKCRLCLLNDEDSCKQCLKPVLEEPTSSSKHPLLGKPLIDCHTAVITYQKKSTPTTTPNPTTNATTPTPILPKFKKSDKSENLKTKESKEPTKPAHITHNVESQEYTCTICTRSFTAKSQIRYHIYCNGGKKPFECNVCNKEFIVRSHYATHMLAHKNLKPYTCTECNKRFFERSKLNRHKLTHTTQRPFVCQECGKSFKIKENLRTHSLIHKNEKPYQCQECGVRFSHSSNLKKHQTVHTSDKTHMCDQCGNRFKLKWALTLHRRSHAKTRPNKCLTCNKSFTHSKDLARHELIHADSKGYSCGICGTTFKRKDNLSRHARNTHPGKKPLIKYVDNPNAIKVITSPPTPTPTPIISVNVIPTVNDHEIRQKQEQHKEYESLKIIDNEKQVPEESNRQQVNGPLKLAFKTSEFKNHYNIHRDIALPVIAQEDVNINIYEKILMPRSPASRITPTIVTPENVLKDKDKQSVCQRILAPFNAPAHYETSFDNKKHAVIKNMKFKLPDNYTNLKSNHSTTNTGTNSNTNNNSDDKRNWKGTSVIVALAETQCTNTIFNSHSDW